MDYKLVVSAAALLGVDSHQVSNDHFVKIRGSFYNL